MNPIQLCRSEMIENSSKLISVILDDVSRLKEQLKSQCADHKEELTKTREQIKEQGEQIKEQGEQIKEQGEQMWRCVCEATGRTNQNLREIMGAEWLRRNSCLGGVRGP